MVVLELLKIAPSILAADFSKLGEEVKRVEDGGADLLHIDVMDGHFVPNISMGPMIVKSLRKETKLPFDVHLMVENPDFFLKSFSDAGSDIITVSVEACLHLNRTIQTIKQLGKKVGVALNPATPICMIENVLEDIDMVLLMCVNPGFHGQAFIPGVLPKIEGCRKMIDERELNIDIEVDGGINEKTAPLVVKAGANVLVAASAIYCKKDVKEAIQALRKACASFVRTN